MERNEVLEILNFRHACKEYDTSKKISPEDLNVIIEGGRLAPSSVGIEPWHFIVVENKDLKEKLATTYFGKPKQITSCSHLVILLTRLPQEINSESNYIDHLLKDIKCLSGDSYNMMMRFLQSVDKRFNNAEEVQAYANNQTYIALSSMMLTAAMLNIDSCAIGGLDTTAATKILVENDLLNTDKFQFTLACTFGYRVKEATPKLRQPISEVVTIVK